MRVLLIANNPDLCAVQPYVTMMPGDEIIQAAADSACLDEVRRLRPDLVLIDTQSELCSSQWLAEMVHNDLSLREIPVLLVPDLEYRNQRPPAAGRGLGAADVYLSGQPAAGSGMQQADLGLIEDLPAAAATRRRALDYIEGIPGGLERQVLESLDKAVVVSELDGTIIYWNRFAAALYGISAERALGRSTEAVLGRRARFYAEQVLPNIAQSGQWNLEYLGRHSSGRMLPIMLSFVPLKDQSGQTVGIIERAVDISDRKESETRYQRALNNAPFPVILHAEDGEIIMINRSFTILSGYEPGQIPRIEDWTEKAFPQRKHFSTTRIEEGEFEITTVWGTRRTWVFSSTQLDRTLDGRQIIMTMAVDITERQEAEAQFRRAVDGAPFPIMINTLDGQITYLNQMWTELTGYELVDLPTVETWATKAFGARMDEVARQVNQQYVRGQRLFYDFDFLIDTKDGRQIVWNFTSAPLGRTSGGKDLVISMAVDITERRMVEQRFEKALMSAPFPVALFNESGQNLFLNQKWIDITGYDLSDIPTREVWLQRAHGDMQAQVQADFMRHDFDADNLSQWGEYSIHTKYDTARVWEISTVSLGKNEAGERLLMAAALDLTERREVERRFEKAVMESPYPISLYSEDGQILMVNHAWSEMTGYSLQEVPNIDRWTELAYRERKEEVQALIKNLSSFDGRIHVGELPIYTRDGGQRIWDFSTVALGFMPDGRRFRMTISVDVTERRALERRFEKAVFESPFPAIMFAEDGEVLMVNRSFTRLSGYRLEDIPTIEMWAETAFRERKAYTEELIQALTQSEQALEVGEAVLYTKDGRRRLWDFHSVYLGILPDGRRYSMWKAADVTERRELEHRFEAAVHEAPFPIGIYDEDGHVLTLNRSFLELTGYSTRDLPTLDAWNRLAFRSSLEMDQDLLRRFVVDQRTDFPQAFNIHTKDGHERIWKFSAAPLGETPEGRRLMIAVAIDITERRAIENRFERAMIEAPFPVVMYAEDGEMLLVSRTWTELTGYSLQDMPTLKRWTELAYGANQEKNYARVSAAIPIDERVRLGEFEINTRFGGRRIWDIHTVSPGRLPDGRRIRLSMGADITELKAIQARFERAIMDAPYPIAMYADDGEMLLLNNAWSETTGYSQQDIPTIDDWMKLALSEHQNALRDRIAHSLQVPAGKQHLGEFTVTTRQGATHIWDISATGLGKWPDGRSVRLVMAVDITEREAAELQFRQAVDYAPYPIAIHAEDGQIVHINRSWLNKSGYSQDQLPSMQEWVRLAFPLQPERALVAIQRGYEVDGEYQGGVFEVRRQDGKHCIWDFMSVGLGRLPDGRRMRMTMASDITDRKRAEEQFRLAVDQAPIPMIIHVEDGRILAVNQTFTELTGFSIDQVPTLADYTARCYPHKAQETLQAVLDGYQHPGTYKSGEYELHTAWGEVRIWDYMSVDLGHLADGSRTRLAIAIDVTDRRR